MPSSTILPRAPRSTRAELASAEHHQTAVIDRLRDMGEDRLVDRLQRCQDARSQRQPGAWPWRCGSAGCWACRRLTIRKWWRGFLQWLGSGPDVSLVTIPLTGTTDLIATLRRLRKAVRDWRDRAHRADPLYGWSAVALAGTVADDRLMLLVQHTGIARETVWSMLERRWPQVMVSVVDTIEPRSDLSVAQAVELAVQRRGIEPVRIVIPAQMRADDQDDGWDEPMPVVL